MSRSGAEVSTGASHQPVEEDEERALALQAVVDAVRLRASPVDGDRCGGCRYYLNPGDALAYCWHPELRVLVGETWWCRHHEPGPEALLPEPPAAY